MERVNESSWMEAVAGALFTLWLSLLSWVGRREVKRIDGKADRDQLDRLITLMEKRDDQYREDQKEANASRRKLHEKFDAYARKQDEILRELTGKVSRLEGRLNGRVDG